LIVPFPPGGPSDIVARPFAELLGDALKSVVVVDNRAGAGGTIGADAAARSSPDGRTLFFATVGTHAINPTLYKSLPYDAVRDFTPIALVAEAPVAIIANPALPASNLGELVALAQRAPGKLNYGSAGNGTPGHLTAEMFKIAAGIDMQHVPYKGARPPGVICSRAGSKSCSILCNQLWRRCTLATCGLLPSAAKPARWRYPMSRPLLNPVFRVSKRQRGGACLRLPSCPPRWPQALRLKLQRS
jgi:hypothetical protein